MDAHTLRLRIPVKWVEIYPTDILIYVLNYVCIKIIIEALYKTAKLKKSLNPKYALIGNWLINLWYMH